MKLWQIAQFLLLGWNWLRLRVHTPFIALHLLSSHVIIHCYIKISAKSCGLHFLHLGQSAATNHRQFSSNWSAMCFVSLSYSQHYVRWGLEREVLLWFCEMSLSKLNKIFSVSAFLFSKQTTCFGRTWTRTLNKKKLFTSGKLLEKYLRELVDLAWNAATWQILNMWINKYLFGSPEAGN